MRLTSGTSYTPYTCCSCWRRFLLDLSSTGASYHH